VTRSRAGRNLINDRIGRVHSLGWVQTVGQDLVEAEVGVQHELAVRRKIRGVGVRAALALAVGARAGVLHGGRGFAQLSVILHRIGGRAAVVVVGHEQPLAGLVERHVARAGALGGNLVQQGQLPGGGVDRKSTHRAVGVLVGRVEEFLVGVNGQERRVAGLAGQPDLRQLARRRLKAVRVYPLAVLARVGADVNQQITLCKGVR